MFSIDPIHHAPTWMRDLVRKTHPTARVVAFVRMYGDVNLEAHPVLRDRTDEVRAMMRGMILDLDAPVFEEVRNGAGWAKNGFDAVGAAFVHDFKMMVA